MKKQEKAVKNPYKYIWLSGFAGFVGFVYFIDGKPGTLSYFMFFSFFGYYFSSKLANEKRDERMIENSKKAWMLASRIPFVLILLMCVTALNFPVSKEFFVLVSSIGFATTVIVHQGAFYYYEKKI